MIKIHECFSKDCVGLDFGTTHSVVCMYNEQYVDFDNSGSFLFKTGRSPKMFDNPNDHSAALKLLTTIRIKTNQYFKRNIKNCVLTVPASFNQIQKNKLMSVATEAGWRIVKIMYEPVAAMLGLNLKNGSHAVCDIGGGTVDISLGYIENNITQVLKTWGDPSLGVEMIDKYVAHELDLKLTDVRDFRESYLNRIGYKNIKNPETDIKNSEINNIKMNGNINAAINNDIVRLYHVYIQKIIDQLNKMLLPDIESVILTGGGSFVIDKTKIRHHNIISASDPLFTVAKGASIYANNLSRGTDRHLLLDSVPMSLGILLETGEREWLIRHGAPFPASGESIFTNSAEDQSEIIINLIQEDKTIGSFNIPIIPGPICSAKINIKFILDYNGILNISVHDLNTNAKKVIQLDSKII